MRRSALILAVQAAAALAAGSAAGQAVSERPDTVAVTIYRESDQDDDDYYDYEDRAEALAEFAAGGLALITETRTVELKAGRQTISFRGVADAMVPETAALEGLPGETAQRNYDFDLLSPGALLDRSVGERVRLVRTNRTTGAASEAEAILRAGPHGVVLHTADGIEALGCGGLTERIVFDRAPEGLSDRATLSAVVDVLKPGRHTLRLSYLATGFNWSADYVAQLAPDGRSLELTGWITLANGGATSFVDAPTQVVAGDIARDDNTQAPEPTKWRLWERRCWPQPYRRVPPKLQVREPMAAMAPAPVYEDGEVEEIVVTGSRIRRLAEQSDLGDYKLYTLPEPTTVAARQSKQVRFLAQERVPVERVYTYRFTTMDLGEEGEPAAPTVLLRMKNEARAGLGKALPSGTVVVMEPAGSERAVFAGQDDIEDTPVGLPVELEIGLAQDVTVTPRLVAEDMRDDGGRAEIEVELVNAKTVPVVAEITHDPDGDIGWKVRRESARHVMKDGAALWRVPLKPGERKLLTYVVQWKD